MNEQFLREHFTATVVKLKTWLRKHGLEGPVSALLEAGEPLAPVGAQLLYVAQPALGLLVQHETISRWATLLEMPEGLAWFRHQLAAASTETFEALVEKSDGV